MNFSATAQNITPLEYYIRQINEQTQKFQANNEKSEDFIKSLKEIVEQLRHVQSQPTISTTITPLIQSIGSAITHSVAFIERFNELYEQANQRLEEITSLQKKLLSLEEELKVYRIYGDWCSKLYLVVSQLMGTTWSRLAELLSIEEDDFEDVWETASVHIQLKGYLATLGITPEMWNNIRLFSQYRNSHFHSGTQGLSKKDKENKASEDWKYIATLDTGKYDVSALYKVLEVVCTRYKWKYLK